MLTVNRSLPAGNVKELIALIRANPGKYSYASAGTGQSAQLSAELFKLTYGLDLVHVPFPGAGPAVLALLALPRGRHRAAYWLLKFAANLGKMSIFAGWHYREYGGAAA